MQCNENACATDQFLQWRTNEANEANLVVLHTTKFTIHIFCIAETFNTNIYKYSFLKITKRSFHLNFYTSSSKTTKKLISFKVLTPITFILISPQKFHYIILSLLLSHSFMQSTRNSRISLKQNIKMQH